MLRRLSVENYALIEKLDIGFDSGLNIITGETGSGKSILLGALGLILGNRAESSALGDASRNCVVEAEFGIGGYGMDPLFAEYDIDYDEGEGCVIRRIINPAGKSRAYVNDIPVQLTALREIGSRLIDIHSQHQTLLLGDSHFQTDILDNVAGNGEKLSVYKAFFTELAAMKRSLAKLLEEASEAGKELEYITFQHSQLCDARLREGELEEAEALLAELTHAAEIKETLGYAAGVLEEGEDNILARLKSMENSIGRLQEFYPRAGDFYGRLHSAVLELRDISSEISSEADRIEADDQLLEETTGRLDMLYSLQQKHRVGSIGELIALRDEYDRRLGNIEGFTVRIEESEKQINALTAKVRALAEEISEKRKKTVPEIQKQVVQMMAELGMPSAQIEIRIEPSEDFTPSGADKVTFLFSANKGSSMQPIEKVASGGEMSRLMLALKALMAGYGKMPTVIFDEIDSGVSGSIADKMGEIISRLAVEIQVVNITHLPQVASKGEAHFMVYKEENARGTRTYIIRLEGEERVRHIAAMLSGAAITEAALRQARILICGTAGSD